MVEAYSPKILAMVRDWENRFRPHLEARPLFGPLVNSAFKVTPIG